MQPLVSAQLGCEVILDYELSLADLVIISQMIKVDVLTLMGKIIKRVCVCVCVCVCTSEHVVNVLHQL